MLTYEMFKSPLLPTHYFTKYTTIKSKPISLNRSDTGSTDLMFVKKRELKQRALNRARRP